MISDSTTETLAVSLVQIDSGLVSESLEGTSPRISQVGISFLKKALSTATVTQSVDYRAKMKMYFCVVCSVCQTKKASA